MSVQGSTASNLTSKFSRSSLRKATGNTNRVHSREEELARATNKRFNNDSWRKVSRNYKAFPVSPAAFEVGGVRNSNSFSNTQILCALSSLTEDQAFQTGSSEIPVLRHSASLNARDQLPSYRKQHKLHASPSHGSDASPNSTDNVSATRRSESTSSSTTNTPDLDPLSLSADGDSGEECFEDCQTDFTSSPSLSRTASPSSLLARSSSCNQASLRSASCRVPKLSPKFRPATRTLPTNAIKRAIDCQHNDEGRSVYGRREHLWSNPKKSSGFLGWMKSIASMFVKFFKLLHYLLMLPDAIMNFITRPRWSGKGKCILITGASSGIGAEVSRQYAAQGARVALVARTCEDLSRIAEECRELGSSKALYYAADLSNPVSTKLAMKQALKDFGKFDVVVLNAGRSHGCYFEEIKDPSQIENMIKLNVNGAITCLHYVLPQVPKNSDSRIVVISNTAGIVAAPYQTIYSATKHALTGFTNALRIELKNTYGKNSPKICLVSFPEVAGTRCNIGRMDMGAKLPPAKWYSWAGIPLPHAVHELLPAIAAGKREFGQPARFDIWRSLYPICPDWVDFWMMRYTQKTHYRPLDEKNKSMPSSNSSKIAISTPHNRSWAC